MAARPQPPASSDHETVDPDLRGTIEAEHSLARGIVVGTVAAVPLCVALWVGVIALAVSGTSAALAGPLAMAAGLGVLTGAFFGAWAGFVSNTHTFEDLDRTTTVHGHRPG
jgi:hypothetical protein